MVGTTLSIRRWQAAMQRFISHPNTHDGIDDIKQAEVASLELSHVKWQSCQVGSHPPIECGRWPLCMRSR